MHQAQESPCLGIRTYDEAEGEAFTRFSNRVIEAFRPSHFMNCGYPVRVAHASELWRYVDVMHELRLRNDLEHYIKRFGAEEFRLLQTVIEGTGNLMRECYGRNESAKNALIRHLNLFRYVEALKAFTGNSRPRVFEIGSGSGYLGVLGGLSGWRYGSMDVTQAFYLWQNQLWNYFFPERVKSWVGKKEKWKGWGENDDDLYHLPWWAVADIFPGEFPACDFYVCDHVLSEMTRNARRYVLACMASSFRNNGGNGVLLVDGWGCPEQASPREVFDDLVLYGFSLVHRDERMSLFLLRENEEAKWGMSENEERGYVPSSVFINPSSRIARLLAKEENRVQRAEVPVEDVLKYYYEQFGDEGMFSADELFYRVVNPVMFKKATGVLT